MINLFNAHIETFSIHRVGNKSRNEGTNISEHTYQLNNEITPLLKEYFLKPFREKEENYFQFTHDVDLEYNEIFNLVSSVFNNVDLFHKASQAITTHLYNQSSHPHIKGGEVYVAYFKNICIDNNIVDAIGIFKSELKSDFLQFKSTNSDLEMILQQGISLDKLDKGVIIFNYKKEDGCKILSIDQNKYDTRYWLEGFLSVDAFEDEAFYTKKYLKFCQQFAKDVVLPAEDKKEEVMFLNRAVNHFAKNDNFVEQDFLNEVLDNPDLISEFKSYKFDKGEKYSIEDLSTFPISNTAVTEARRKFKNIINLDTGITIKLDFVNPENAEKFVEKGWDEERQMYYYLTYFNKES